MKSALFVFLAALVLAATARAGGLTLVAGQPNFGRFPIGSVVSRTLTIKNTSGVTISYLNGGLSGAFRYQGGIFAGGGTCLSYSGVPGGSNYKLPAGGQCTLKVKFVPPYGAYFQRGLTISYWNGWGTVVATVTTLTGIGNIPPVASNTSVGTNEDSSVALSLTASDGNGDALAYGVMSNPIHGTLSGTPPSLIYTPAANYNGQDSFTFRVSDGLADSNTATVNILVNAVNDPPVAFSQSIATDEDTAKSITLSGFDVEGDTLSFVIVNPPAHGSLSGNAPNVVYTPQGNYNGPDQIIFRANDGNANSNEATILIGVRPVVDQGLDPYFGDGGIVVDRSLAFRNGTVAAALQLDGKILVAQASSTGSVARYEENGELDLTFGVAGRVLLGGVLALAVQPDNKIVLVRARYYSDTAWDFDVIRLNPDGSLDGSFSGERAHFLGSDFPTSLALQPDGKILVAGYSYNPANTETKVSIARYNENGALDNSFGTGGRQTTSFGEVRSYAKALALQADGKIIVVGCTAELNWANADIGLARYNVSGSPDVSFGNQGILRLDRGDYEYGYDVALQPDGKIVVAEYNGYLARVTSGGAIDTSFGTSGWVHNGNYHHSLLLLDGKIVVGGYTYNGPADFMMARFHSSSGQRDSSFDHDGTFVQSIGAGYDRGYKLLAQPDGKIVLVGITLEANGDEFTAMIRYQP